MLMQVMSCALTAARMLPNDWLAFSISVCALWPVWQALQISRFTSTAGGYSLLRVASPSMALRELLRDSSPGALLSLP